MPAPATLARWLDRSVDHVRVPSPLDASAAFAKDWLHLNLFDHASGTVGLINASMHGDPSSASAIAVGCALFHHPQAGWWGGADVQAARSAHIDLAGFGLGSVGFVFTDDAGVAVSVARPGITASLAARPLERAIIVEDRLPFGSGWISWRAVPRLAVEGQLELLGHDHDLARFSVYHDHNWGRWRWGDDAGWEWGAFLAEEPGPAFVLSRPTNRAHTTGGPLLTVHASGREWRFSGRAVRIERHGRWAGEIYRVPGAVAALRTDRRLPGLPEQVAVTFDDGRDHGQISFDVTGAAQIVCVDPAAPGVGFIHELCGTGRWRTTLAGAEAEGRALGVVELAD
jgi:hypothetical protein